MGITADGISKELLGFRIEPIFFGPNSKFRESFGIFAVECLFPLQ
jgi:hypothetical protein